MTDAVHNAFHGAKIALICGDRLLVYRRDRKAGIPNPGLWDFAGGGREGEESPDRCALRELEEEFGLRLDPSRIGWRRAYPSVDHPGHVGWFMAAAIEEAEIASVRFGPEGEEWRMMAIAEFLTHPEAVPALRRRLGDFLEAMA